MINKYQQGGEVEDQQSSPEEQVIALLQAAQQGNKQAQQQLAQIQQAAKQGNKQAIQIMQLIQQVMQQQQQQQTQSARMGAKLEYIKRLKGECPEGQELTYYKAGGRICKACVQKAKQQAKFQKGNMKEDNSPVAQFKKDRVEKGAVKEAKCGCKVKKAKKMQEGGTVRTAPRTTYKGHKLDIDQRQGRKPVGEDKQGRHLYLNGDGQVGPADPKTENLKYRGKSLKNLWDGETNLTGFKSAQEEKCGGKMTKHVVKKHLYGGSLTLNYVNNSLNRLKGE